MGQKVSPVGLRIGINKDWSASWYANNKDMAKFLHNDIKIREYLETTLKRAAIANILINRDQNKTEVIVITAKPGVVIGQGGEGIEKIRKHLEKITKETIQVSIKEEKNPNLNAALVAEDIARQIENRVHFRMAQKRAMRNAVKAGAKGVRTAVSGRLGGADMARTEGYTEGMVPLHTLRGDIDYANKEANTTYGKIGVKVWLYKGEILPEKKDKGGENDGADSQKN